MYQWNWRPVQSCPLLIYPMARIRLVQSEYATPWSTQYILQGRADGRLEEGQQAREIHLVVFLYQKTGRCKHKIGYKSVETVEGCISNGFFRCES
jgi:hypothetical protein